MSSQDKIDGLYDQLTQADKTFGDLPLELRLQIEKVSQSLPELGARFLQKSGVGTEFFETKEYKTGDDIRAINARMSARSTTPIVVHKQAEIRQHIYLWRDPDVRMKFQSNGTKYSQETAANIMLFALANHLIKSEEVVSILNSKSLYKGGNISPYLAENLLHMAASSSREMPEVIRRVPKNSTAILFSDFMMNDIKTIEKGLKHMRSMGLSGCLVMVVDPQILEFDFKDNQKFIDYHDNNDSDDTPTIIFNNTIKKQYLEKIKDHIISLQKTAKEYDFDLILQRTDEPLSNGLIALYEKNTNTVEKQIKTIPSFKKDIG